MKVNIECPSAMVLHDFVLGLLAEDESLTIESHVFDCQVCVQHIAEEKKSDPLIDTLRAQWKNPVIPISQEVGPIQQRLHNAYSEISTKVSLHHDLHTPEARLFKNDTQVGKGSQPVNDGLPRNIAHYVLKELLGAGGTGAVYRAWDSKLGRQVALKIILDRRLWNPQHSDRFTSEAGTLAKLQHSQIVQIYEVGEEQGRAYLVLEYLAGGDLASRLRGLPQHTIDSARLVMQLAIAAQHAHTQGVIHRDLKPANILIETPNVQENAARPLENIQAKIADFGLAKRMEVPGMTETGVVLGTPGYMAPESFRHTNEKQRQDPSIDVYSLGAILYEMLTGRPPFRGETVAETLLQVQTSFPLSPRKLRPGLSRDLETICLHSLEREPRLRYPTAQHLADDLKRFLSKEPIIARPANVFERTIKWARRRPALAALVTLLFCCLLLLLLGGITYERRLQAELKKTETERDRVDTSYHQAREALEGMLAKLDDPHRANVPQLQALRREQQLEIVQFLQSFSAITSDDPKVMRDVALALYKSGRLRIVLGEFEPARKDLQRSIDIMSKLLTPVPTDFGLRRELAGIYSALGATYPFGPDFLRCNETACAAQTKLLQEQPDNQIVRRALALSFHNIGSNYLSTGAPDKAETNLLHSMSLLEQVPGNIDTPQMKVEFAETEANLSLVYQNLKQPDNAEKYYLRSSERLESVMKADPQNINVLMSLCALRVNRSTAIFNKNQPEASLALLNTNVRDLKAVLQREPDFQEAKKRLFETQGNRGNGLGVLGRHREAAMAFRDVVALSPAGEKDYYRLFLGSSEARAGNYRQSLDDFILAGNCQTFNYEQKAFLALNYCINAASITKDQTLSAAQRSELLKQCHEQAIHWLGQTQQSANLGEWSKMILVFEFDTAWFPLRENKIAWDWVQQHLKKP